MPYREFPCGVPREGVMKQFTKLMAGWLSLVLLVSPLRAAEMNVVPGQVQYGGRLELAADAADRKSTRLNSSH